MPPLVVKILAAAGALVLAGILVAVALAWKRSLLPDSYNVMDYGRLDYGGGAARAESREGHSGHGGGISVSDLKGPSGKPDARFTLTARRAEVRLASGRKVDALTFDGRVPGPELRVQKNALVEVTLANEDIEGGVSIHWHGVDVPNAEDGVAGVTQNAVAPGERYTYRFRADRAGTFWYHSHQTSAKEVKRGLFGAFVVAPGRSAPASSRALDLSVIAHELSGAQTLNGRDGVQSRAVPGGTAVRLRLINSDSVPRRFTVTGTAFRVVAIDGIDLNAPQPLLGKTLRIAAGGRYDVALTMPRTPVTLVLGGSDAVLALTPDGRPPAAGSPDTGSSSRDEVYFDPARYGRPAPTPFGASSRFARRFRFDIGRKLGFLEGRPGVQWTINGGIYPDVPVFVVEKGDLVKLTIVNHTDSVHPMHLHGHHVLVLSRDGVPVSGSPWWSDTLDVQPGERYEVAFRADNPGLWMDHCHNLRHAAEGLTMHLAYAGIETPFGIGGRAHNKPE